MVKLVKHEHLFRSPQWDVAGSARVVQCVSTQHQFAHVLVECDREALAVNGGDPCGRSLAVAVITQHFVLLVVPDSGLMPRRAYSPVFAAPPRSP